MCLKCVHPAVRENEADLFGTQSGRKKLSMELWTYRTLNKRHVGNVVEAAECAS